MRLHRIGWLKSAITTRQYVMDYTSLDIKLSGSRFKTVLGGWHEVNTPSTKHTTSLQVIVSQLFSKLLYSWLLSWLQILIAWILLWESLALERSAPWDFLEGLTPFWFLLFKSFFYGLEALDMMLLWEVRVTHPFAKARISNSKTSLKHI